MGSRALAWTLAIALAAPAEASKTSWPVEFAQGDFPYIPQHKNLTLEVADRSIRVLRQDETVGAIPGDSIVTVVYDSAPYRPVVGYFRGSPGISAASGGGWAAGAALGLFVVVIPVLLAPIVKTQHFVTLVWKDHDLVRSVSLQVKGKDREAILSALSAATGAAWRDAPAERDRLAKDLGAAKSTSFAFDLDRQAFVADTYLDAGTHRAVVLDGVNGPELIVFEGSSYNPKKVLLSTPVRVQKTTSQEESAAAAGEPGASTREPGSRDAVVIHRDTPDGSTIEELRVGDRSITLPDFVVTPPGSPRPVPGTDGKVVEISFGQFAVGTITRTEYEGEEAFRFQVIRIDFALTSTFPAADLYVTPERVIFDPGDTKAARRRRLEFRRDEIINVDSGAMDNPATVRLTTEKEKHLFRLRAPGRGQPATPVWPLDHGRTRLVETRLADFVRLAIRNFKAADSLYEGWLAGVPGLAPAETDENQGESPP